jgi:PPOX class probable FMN-dependent enzyme
MQTIHSIEELASLYDSVVPGAITKVCDHLTPQYQKWINGTRFLILSTVGPEGTDASPRGDIESVVRIVDQKTLWLPDWRGNNRMDSLRNIVRDGRVSLLFMVPGSNNVVRINGTAKLTADKEITDLFDRSGKTPKTVIVISVDEVYFQCAKALMRSRLWLSGDERAGVPTAGQFLQERQEAFDAEAYDAGYSEYAKDRMW